MLKHNGQSQQRYADITDTGCVRKLNEDTVFSSDNLWLVADGMGGHACGDVASQLAAQTIVSEFSKSGCLREAIETAHAKVLEEGRNRQGQKGMGTTVVALFCDNNDEFEVAWVGDSRAYLWQANIYTLTPLTTDHSLVATMVSNGQLSAEQAKRHPKRHMITRCLGSKDSNAFDVDICQGAWQPKQKILLCSDGLSDAVSDEQISAFLEQQGSNDHKLELLLNAAKEAGGKDNISAILIDSPL
jgi:serine/threonine protein phosphatase PrpC